MKLEITKWDEQQKDYADYRIIGLEEEDEVEGGIVYRLYKFQWCLNCIKSRIRD